MLGKKKAKKTTKQRGQTTVIHIHGEVSVAALVRLIKKHSRDGGRVVVT